MSKEVALPGNADSLEAKLENMRRYGAPKLSFLTKGWYCRVEMHVVSQGATFEVASDFHLPTPTVAVDQCMARIIETLQQYKSLA